MTIILVGNLPDLDETDFDFNAHIDGKIFNCVQNAPDEPNVWRGASQDLQGDESPLYSGAVASAFIRQVLDAWNFQLRQQQYTSPVSPEINQAINAYAASTP